MYFSICIISSVFKIYSSLILTVCLQVTFDLQFYGLLLLINQDQEWCQRWFKFRNTDGSMDFSIPNFLIKLEYHLQNLTHINLQKISTISSIFFDGLSNIILSNAQEIISGVEGGLLQIKNLCGAFINW